MPKNNTKKNAPLVPVLDYDLNKNLIHTFLSEEKFKKGSTIDFSELAKCGITKDTYDRYKVDFADKCSDSKNTYKSFQQIKTYSASAEPDNEFKKFLLFQKKAIIESSIIEDVQNVAVQVYLLSNELTTNHSNTAKSDLLSVIYKENITDKESYTYEDFTGDLSQVFNSYFFGGKGTIKSFTKYFDLSVDEKPKPKDKAKKSSKEDYNKINQSSKRLEKHAFFTYFKTKNNISVCVLKTIFKTIQSAHSSWNECNKSFTEEKKDFNNKILDKEKEFISKYKIENFDILKDIGKFIVKNFKNPVISFEKMFKVSKDHLVSDIEILLGSKEGETYINNPDHIKTLTGFRKDIKEIYDIGFSQDSVAAKLISLYIEYFSEKSYYNKESDSFEEKKTANFPLFSSDSFFDKFPIITIDKSNNYLGIKTGESYIYNGDVFLETKYGAIKVLSNKRLNNPIIIKYKDTPYICYNSKSKANNNSKRIQSENQFIVNEFNFKIKKDNSIECKFAVNSKFATNYLGHSKNSIQELVNSFYGEIEDLDKDAFKEKQNKAISALKEMESIEPVRVIGVDLGHNPLFAYSVIKIDSNNTERKTIQKIIPDNLFFFQNGYVEENSGLFCEANKNPKIFNGINFEEVASHKNKIDYAKTIGHKDLIDMILKYNSVLDDYRKVFSHLNRLYALCNKENIKSEKDLEVYLEKTHPKYRKNMSDFTLVNKIIPNFSIEKLLKNKIKNDTWNSFVLNRNNFNEITSYFKRGVCPDYNYYLDYVMNYKSFYSSYIKLNQKFCGKDEVVKSKLKNGLERRIKNFKKTLLKTIANAIISMAKVNKCSIIVLEDLQGLTAKHTNSKEHNALINNKSFGKLLDYIKDSASIYGIYIHIVNPDMTSQSDFENCKIGFRSGNNFNNKKEINANKQNLYFEDKVVNSDVQAAKNIALKFLCSNFFINKIRAEIDDNSNSITLSKKKNIEHVFSKIAPSGKLKINNKDYTLKFKKKDIKYPMPHLFIINDDSSLKVMNQADMNAYNEKIHFKYGIKFEEK